MVQPLCLYARRRIVCVAIFGVVGFASASTPVHAISVARMWNEQLLAGIRKDFARPTVHARNLYHVSLAMYDAWAAYDDTALQILANESATAVDIESARDESISYAAYRVMKARFGSSPGAAITIPALDNLMDTLGFDKGYEGTVGQSPAALGNRIAAQVLGMGLFDNSNEAGGYVNRHYLPINPPILPDLPGNPDLMFPNRWQPIALQFFIDQGGNVVVGGYPEFLSPEWGQVTPFSMTSDDLTIYNRDGFDYWVYHDPGAPPMLDTATEDYYKSGFEQVAIWSGHLDPADGVMIDISPASFGNSPLPEADDHEAYYDRLEGGDWGQGYAVNPVTGVPYTPQVVARGDYTRILAEFWADGPASETPPGHWFTILNYVSDHPSFEKRWRGVGPLLNDLEWDVKSYLVLGGAMHDVAISAWGVKGWYDYLRPVSAIRYMCDLGQCSDDQQPSYNADGIHLVPGHIELVTSATTMPGQRHAHLAGNEGKIALWAWRGPNFISNPATDAAGVGWILAEDWWPYQRPSFVTPPFAGYVSGHSTFSRAAAEIMTVMTGSPYFPDGLGEFLCPRNEFLVFEEGPTMDITLQWASYRDASDQTSLSRIWGGIHPPADDLPGRTMGVEIGLGAFGYAFQHFEGATVKGDINCDGIVDMDDVPPMVDVMVGTNGNPCHNAAADVNIDGIADGTDIQEFLDILLP